MILVNYKEKLWITQKFNKNKKSYPQGYPQGVEKI